MLQKIVHSGYEPREFQAVLHNELKRFNVLVCHRRFGKTVFSINEMIDQGLRSPHKNPQYAYVAPTYGQAKRVAWEMLKQYTDKFPGIKTNEAELKMTMARPWNGDKVTFMLLGAEKFDSHRGIYLDGAILDEYADCDPQIWSKVIRPTLSDRLGWSIFIGTPKGENHFYKIYQDAQSQDDWHTAIYRASETGIIPQSELDAARRTMSEEEYLQEFECDFTAALIGAYYGPQMSKADKEKRITRVPHQPDFNVFTAWDLGVNDQTAIWFFQLVGREFHFIDYYENSDKGLDHYVKHVLEKDYVYARHYLPHDVSQREMSTGKERLFTLKNLGLKNPYVVPKARNVADDINACRVIIPRCYFDSVRCERGVSALKNYQRKWDPKDMVYSKNPLHNWASHGADAFRTFAMGHRDEFGQFSGRMRREVEYDYNALEA